MKSSLVEESSSSSIAMSEQAQVLNDQVAFFQVNGELGFEAGAPAKRSDGDGVPTPKAKPAAPEPPPERRAPERPFQEKAALKQALRPGAEVAQPKPPAAKSIGGGDGEWVEF